MSAVEPLSPAQLSAWDDAQTPPVAELVAPQVWAIPVPIPAGTIPHTLCYALFGGDGVHLIDPGWGHPDGIRALEAGLASAGAALADVRTVIATHFHPDHLGAAAELRERCGARVVFSRVEQQVLHTETSAEATDISAYRETLRGWGVPEPRWDELIASFGRPSLVASGSPDLAVDDGDVLDLSGHRLHVLATPGHTEGHICLIDEERGLLYSGDHVLPRIYSGVGIGVLPGSDALHDYFHSLDRLAPYDEFVVLPGHEFRFRGLAARRAQVAAHHLRRTREVAALADELGDAPVWDYARRLTWTAGWSGMSGFWLHSALRQTAMHRDYARTASARARLGAAPPA
ncbi:MBL fold metallo-hydrolase [Microbacterium panaciterrae]|uniref:MBL fold metallo-hydrolase n=1 Tax=Microbacterium panaciterrae TaxID=985759 RepID=UPI0031E9997B